MNERPRQTDGGWPIIPLHEGEEKRTAICPDCGEIGIPKYHSGAWAGFSMTVFSCSEDHWWGEGHDHFRGRIFKNMHKLAE